MTEQNRDNLGYLGQSFQQKVLWQLLTVPEFSEHIVEQLTASYFDNQHHKYIMSMIKKYHEQNNIPANIRNRSIYEFVAENTRNEIDKEQIFNILHQIVNYDRSVTMGQIYNDGESVQKKVWLFVKQQEARKIASEIMEKIKTGEIEDNVHHFEEKFTMIMNLGLTHDHGENVFNNKENALRENYREPTPTGIKLMDQAMAGGLGKGEMGIALMPYGIGKTTFLTKAANTGFDEGRHVLQLFFEDNVDDIKRKHYAIWSKIPLSEISKRSAEVLGAVNKYEEEYAKRVEKKGSLTLKKWKTEDGAPTIPNIEKWILNYQKLFGIKFDLLCLDYLDCCDSHKPTHGDRNEAELVVVKAFEALVGDLNIPGWTAVQGNRTAIRSEYVHGDQMGGNIKRAQKTHFLFSVAKSQEQKQDNLANVQIIKSRMTKDGQMYENAIYNNDTLEIKLIDGVRPSNMRGEPKESTAVNQQLTNNLFNEAVNKLIDEQVRKNNEIVAKNIVENNSVDYQQDKKSEIVSTESVGEI
jgi:replicative DNA helicase